MRKLFYNSHINKINITNLKTNNVEDMSYLFAYTDLENFDSNEIEINTENVKDMSFMFYGCKYLNWIDLTSFKTDNVINMTGMFKDVYLW